MGAGGARTLRRDLLLGGSAAQPDRRAHRARRGLRGVIPDRAARDALRFEAIRSANTAAGNAVAPGATYGSAHRASRLEPIGPVAERVVQNPDSRRPRTFK